MAMAGADQRSDPSLAPRPVRAHERAPVCPVLRRCDLPTSGRRWACRIRAPGSARSRRSHRDRARHHHRSCGIDRRRPGAHRRGGDAVESATKSATFQLRMHHADTGRLHATYDVVEVFFDPGTRASVEIPAGIRAKLQADTWPGRNSAHWQPGAPPSPVSAGRAISPTPRGPTARMRGLFPPTPLQRNAYLSHKLRCRDLAEARGSVARAVLQDPRRVQRHAQAAGRVIPTRVFVAASAGNHAQGIAYVCRISA